MSAIWESANWESAIWDATIITELALQKAHDLLEKCQQNKNAKNR